MQSKTISIQIHLFSMNALVLSHLHYSSIILNSISQNLVASLDQIGQKIVFQLTEIRLIAGSQRSISCFTDPIFWTSNSFISVGCHKIHSLHSKPCHSLLSLYLKIKELVNWIVMSDTQLPFSKIV